MAWSLSHSSTAFVLGFVFMLALLSSCSASVIAEEADSCFFSSSAVSHGLVLVDVSASRIARKPVLHNMSHQFPSGVSKAFRPFPTPVAKGNRFYELVRRKRAAASVAGKQLGYPPARQPRPDLGGRDHRGTLFARRLGNAIRPPTAGIHREQLGASVQSGPPPSQRLAGPGRGPDKKSMPSMHINMISTGAQHAKVKAQHAMHMTVTSSGSATDAMKMIRRQRKALEGARSMADVSSKYGPTVSAEHGRRSVGGVASVQSMLTKQLKTALSRSFASKVVWHAGGISGDEVGEVMQKTNKSHHGKTTESAGADHINRINRETTKDSDEHDEFSDRWVDVDSTHPPSAASSDRFDYPSGKSGDSASDTWDYPSDGQHSPPSDTWDYSSDGQQPPSDEDTFQADNKPAARAQVRRSSGQSDGRDEIQAPEPVSPYPFSPDRPDSDDDAAETQSKPKRAPIPARSPERQDFSSPDTWQIDDLKVQKDSKQQQATRHAPGTSHSNLPWSARNSAANSQNSKRSSSRGGNVDDPTKEGSRARGDGATSRKSAQQEVGAAGSAASNEAARETTRRSRAKRPDEAGESTQGGRGVQEAKDGQEPTGGEGDGELGAESEDYGESGDEGEPKKAGAPTIRSALGFVLPLVAALCCFTRQMC